MASMTVAACASETEVLGVNSPAQLADLERRYQRLRAEALMEAGVRLADPARLDVRGELVCAADVDIDVVLGYKWSICPVGWRQTGALPSSIDP